jgi:uncharacterized protein (DUF2235 family)
VRRAKRAAALPCGHCEKDKYNEGSTKRLGTVVTMNDKATRIAEAEAKPEAARPERATATRRCEGVARSNLLLGNINSF